MKQFLIGFVCLLVGVLTAMFVMVTFEPFAESEKYIRITATNGNQALIKKTEIEFVGDYGDERRIFYRPAVDGERHPVKVKESLDWIEEQLK